jgi:hypothetical protein
MQLYQASCSGCSWLRIGTSGGPLWVTIGFLRTPLDGISFLFAAIDRWRDVLIFIETSGRSPQVGYQIIARPTSTWQHWERGKNILPSPRAGFETAVPMVVRLRTDYEGVSKSFRTGRVERELQTVQLSATRCSGIAILWVSLVTFAAITRCVASQRVIPKVSVYFIIDSVRKLLDTPSYTATGIGITLQWRI